nr:reverse transcriptase domain-containing protein [Tanacetum cinerariifolium]
MRTRSSSNLPVVSPLNPSTSNPKRRNRRCSKQPFILKESLVDTIADQRTMAELLCAPTEGYAEAIMFDESFHEAWDRYNDLLRTCPHHGFTKYHQLDTFYNALNQADQDSFNSAAGGYLLERRTQDMLTIIENKSKCLAAGGNTFPELRDNIQGYVAAAVVNYNQGNSVHRPPAITTRSGIVLDGPFVPIPPLFINMEEDERVEETLTDQDLVEYTIKVPPPLVQKSKPPSQRDFVLHINITLADDLILISKYQKMLKALLSNKEKLQELENTPLNENCSAVILKKLSEKLKDPEKFLIPYGFNELKCKSLTDLGASINLMPLSVWKKLAGIARDVFIPVGKFTFPTDFVIVDYESDPRVSRILGRPFLRTARAFIDVYGEEMILCDCDERLTLNMRHDTSSYSNQPQKESINMINVFNDSSEDFLEDLFSTNQPSGNPTFSSYPELTSLEVKDDIFDPEGEYDDDLQFDIESNLKEIEYLLHHDPIKDINSILKDSIDQNNLADLNDNLVDFMPEIFTDEHALDYSSPPLFDEYDDDLFESDTKNVYDDPFDSKGEKIKESKLLIDELDLPCDFLLPF